MVYLTLLTNRDEMVNVATNVSYNNCKMTELKINMKTEKVIWRIRTPDLCSTDFSLFRELLGKIPCQVMMMMKETQASSFLII